jgi:hypothetical protein
MDSFLNYVPAAPKGCDEVWEINYPDDVAGSTLDEEALALSMATESTRPGETIAATGCGLDGASILIWNSQLTEHVLPLYAKNDRILALLPENIGNGPLLLWPVRGKFCGAPLRLNAPIIWWYRLEQDTLRIFGRNFSGPNVQVWLSGDSVSISLEVRSSDAWQIEVTLPPHLSAGHYSIQCHNGMGAALGWSESASMAIPDRPQRSFERVFRASEYGALPNQLDPCDASLQACLQAASKQGGTVLLEPGIYRLSQPVCILSGCPVRLCGAGMGGHQWTRAEDCHRVDAEATQWVCSESGCGLPELLRVEADNSVVEGITFVNGVDGGLQRCVTVVGAGVVVEGCRFITPDLMPKVTPDEREAHSVESAALQLETSGNADLLVQHCDFHHLGMGIQIGGPGHSATPTRTDGVRITECSFTGYFPGLYKKGEEVEIFYSGFRCIAVVNAWGSRCIVEKCRMQGADRTGGRCMNRMVLSLNSSNRHMFVSGNRGEQVGNHRSLGEGLDHNMGEQIMFHFRAEDGGIFQALKADSESVTLDLNDKRLSGEVTSRNFDGKTLFTAVSSPLGSRVPESVGVKPGWMLFICGGRGVGQYRRVTGIVRGEGWVRLSVESPWRVRPDAGSRLVLQVCYHQNHVVNNWIDAGEIDPIHKSHGTVFWFNSIENIVSNNDYRNLAGGVVWNHGYRNPTAWNQTTDNRFSGIQGESGDTSETPACWVNHFRVFGDWPIPEERVVYSVGEVCRRNRGRDADVGAYLHARYETGLLVLADHVPHPYGGIALSVVEKCEFEEVRCGIVVSSPANGIILRDNRIELAETEAHSEKIFDQSLKSAITVECFIRTDELHEAGLLK